jgi:hypothetical protein
MAVQRPSQYQEPQPIDATTAAQARASILLQGTSGAGKTHFCCSMPQPIIIGNTEPNISVPVGRIEEGVDITMYPLKDWADYQWFVRKTKNREWDAATVVLDSYTLVGDFIQLAMKAQPGAVNKEGQLTWSKWDQVKGNQFNEVLDLLSAVKPMEGKPTYHVVVTVHEQEEAIRNPAGEITGISAINPAVPGGIRKSFGAKFDCVFYAVGGISREKDAQGVARPVGASHVLWTVPPDNLRAVKDGLGGNGGRKVLPATVENTWQALCAGWGREPGNQGVGAGPRSQQAG